MPPLFAEYYRLFREVEIQQEIYKVLYPQFEQQKLNFNEINSGLSLIDEPTLPTYKFYPKRAFIVIAFFLLGFIVLLLRLWYEHWVAYQGHSQSCMINTIRLLKARYWSTEAYIAFYSLHR